MTRRALIWGTCLAALFLLVRGHAVRDPDSLLYEMIARSLESQPLSRWIAPRYPADWPTNRGLFAEHFACFFWPAALLGRLGLRGALAANFCWTLLSYALLFRFARAAASGEAAWAAVFLYAASPVGLQYLVRANHEPALACAYFGALWCLAGERPRPALLALFVLLAVAIKGALGLAVFPVALVAWAALRRRRADLAGLAAGAALVAAFVAGYEAAYAHATGASFLRAYLSRQLYGVAEQEQRGFWNALATPAYYLASLAWFALPGSALVLLEAAVRRRVSGKPALVTAAACAALFSLMARRAVRYVFPAFGLCAVAGAQSLLALAPRARGFLAAHERQLEPALAAFTVAAAALRIAYA